MGGFCQGRGCPVPDNLADYRGGKVGGGYFSDPRSCELACSLIEMLSEDGVCTEGPELTDADPKGKTVLRDCRHPAKWTMDSIATALGRDGDEPQIINVVERKA